MSFLRDVKVTQQKHANRGKRLIDSSRNLPYFHFANIIILEQVLLSDPIRIGCCWLTMACSHLFVAQ